jgi:hypothetical protein
MALRLVKLPKKVIEPLLLGRIQRRRLSEGACPVALFLKHLCQVVPTQLPRR